MAHPKLKPAKPVDRIAFEPVMLNLSKARALARFLEHLGDADSELRHIVDDGMDGDVPDCTVPWVHQAVADELRRTHDEIEREYRQVTNVALMQRHHPESFDAPPKDGA